jgi:TonB family protein
MQTSELAHFLILFAAACLQAQDAPPPKLDFDALPPPVRNPHSIAADMAVPLCPATFNDSFESNGIASKDDKTVTPPRAKHMQDAKFSAEARRQKDSKYFAVIVSLVVDANGMPQNVCLKQSAGYGLDAKAAEAVERYRFAPASKEGKPVPVRIYDKVEFRLY